MKESEKHAESIATTVVKGQLFPLLQKLEDQTSVGWVKEGRKPTDMSMWECELELSYGYLYDALIISIDNVFSDTPDVKMVSNDEFVKLVAKDQPKD